jgi:hypothetical protein
MHSARRIVVCKKLKGRNNWPGNHLADLTPAENSVNFNSSHVVAVVHVGNKNPFFNLT